MPSYWVDPSGERKLKRVKKAPKEYQTEKLVAIYPKLLGHKRKIVWFWKRSNGPGDLFGFDSKGRFLVVEFKKKVGTREGKKALSQISEALKTNKKLSPEQIQKHYARFREKYLSNQTYETFEEQFRDVTGHKLDKKTDFPYSYVVASYFTYAGLQLVRTAIRRRKRGPRFVATQILDNKGKLSLVATETLTL